MVKCLKKYGISFETAQPSTEIQKEMPLWHHPGEDRNKRQENNGKKAKCMRRKHAALTIGDGLELTQRLDNPLHTSQVSCMCDKCNDDRSARGCENPHACAIAAASRIGQILPKWIPKQGETVGPSPTTMPQSQEDDTGLFVPPENITRLAQGLRVMTLRDSEPKERPNPPARRRA
ncbi:hypothetical protein DFH08DRAFT_620871, partial [Mycena albidolilacea]